MKEVYQDAQMSVIHFEAVDVITTSDALKLPEPENPSYDAFS